VDCQLGTDPEADENRAEAALDGSSYIFTHSRPSGYSATKEIIMNHAKNMKNCLTLLAVLLNALLLPATAAAQKPDAADWKERILNGDGTINWTNYVDVANNYNRRDIIDYRFGPRYSHYHPNPETIPTVYSNSDAHGWHNGGQKRPTTHEEFVEWYAEGGQLLISPDADAPTEWQPGVAQCWNGSIWGFKAPISPPYALLNRLTFDEVMTAHGSRALPDPGPVKKEWKDASGGRVPAPPVAVVRTHAMAGVTGFMIFTDGLIGACGTGNDPYKYTSVKRPHVKLPNGKVPTAAAVSGCNEFLLVTVWDTANRKGQVAVIAIKGWLVTAEVSAEKANAEKANPVKLLYGLPNWPVVAGMKLLGFVDLPFAAPTAIKVAQDVAQSNGRGHGDNAALDLNSQAERDTWYNHSGSQWKRTARCGYAVVSSRAENKVAFIDLQPLFQYYRTMYFTTRANYDQTKNEGPADNQWPYTFAYAPGQKPTVHSTINVTQPTAVAAGMPNTKWRLRNGAVFAQNAYVASMDGKLRIYKVGNLMTTDSGGGRIGAPFNTVVIGKNPCNIDYGHGGNMGDDLFITCRGDNAVYFLNYDGSFLDHFLLHRLLIDISNRVNVRGNCFWRVAPETAVGPDRRAGKRGLARWGYTTENTLAKTTPEARRQANCGRGFARASIISTIGV
jgi:hypothetical protein